MRRRNPPPARLAAGPASLLVLLCLAFVAGAAAQQQPALDAACAGLDAVQVHFESQATGTVKNSGGKGSRRRFAPLLPRGTVSPRDSSVCCCRRCSLNPAAPSHRTPPPFETRLAWCSCQAGNGRAGGAAARGSAWGLAGFGSCLEELCPPPNSRGDFSARGARQPSVLHRCASILLPRAFLALDPSITRPCPPPTHNKTHSKLARGPNQPTPTYA